MTIAHLALPSRARNELSGRFQQSRPDEDVVGSLAERHAYARGCSRRALGHGRHCGDLGRDGHMQRLTKAIDDLGDDHLVRHVAALDRDVCLGIERVASVDKRLQHDLGVAVLEQRTVATLGDAANEKRRGLP